MKQLDLNKIVCLTLFLIYSLLGHSQTSVTLQFIGLDQNGQYVKLNHLIIENITKHWQELLYYPDTTFIMGITGVEESHGGGEGVRLAGRKRGCFGL